MSEFPWQKRLMVVLKSEKVLTYIVISNDEGSSIGLCGWLSVQYFSLLPSDGLVIFPVMTPTFPHRLLEWMHGAKFHI